MLGSASKNYSKSTHFYYLALFLMAFLLHNQLYEVADSLAKIPKSSEVSVGWKLTFKSYNDSKLYVQYIVHFRVACVGKIHPFLEPRCQPLCCQLEFDILNHILFWPGSTRRCRCARWLVNRLTRSVIDIWISIFQNPDNREI